MGHKVIHVHVLGSSIVSDSDLGTVPCDLERLLGVGAGVGLQQEDVGLPFSFELKTLGEKGRLLSEPAVRFSITWG